MAAARTDDAVSLLATWLTARPDDFAGAVAQAAIRGLLDLAEMGRQAALQHHHHRARWLLLPEDVRRVAGRRQLAALAARLAMRNGLEPKAAVAWVIELANLTRRDFARACAETLRNGDHLFVWQWRELRELGLRDDFMSRRQVELWLELEEPWVTDARWVFPLHLVDAAVLDQYEGDTNHVHVAAA